MLKNPQNDRVYAPATSLHRSKSDADTFDFQHRWRQCMGVPKWETRAWYSSILGEDQCKI